VISADRIEDETTGERDYTYPPTGELLTSVTTILGGTLGKPWLPAWAAKLAAVLAVDQIDVLLRILRDEGRDAAVKWLSEGAERERNVKRGAGSYVHDVTEALVLWAVSPAGTGHAVHIPELPGHLVGATYDEEPIEDVVEYMVDGFTNWVADFNPRWIASEMTVFNQPLGYAGTLDLIIELLGYGVGRSERLIAAPGNIYRPCVDIKTGREPECTWREQIAAYRRAREALLRLGQIIPMPATTGGAVLHLRPKYVRGYQFMPVSRENDVIAWNRFRRAAEIFNGRRADSAKPGHVVRPLRPDGTMPPPLIADLNSEGYGVAPSALAKAGVRDLEQVAAMTAGQLRATKGIGPKTVEVIRRMLDDHGLHLAGETPTTPTKEEAA
jgi:hypothetical protein